MELAIELTETNLTINTTKALFYSLSPFYLMERSIVIFIIMVMFAVCSSFRILFLFVRNNKSSVANDAFSLRSFLSSDDLVTFSFHRKSNKTQYIHITDT